MMDTQYGYSLRRCCRPRHEAVEQLEMALEKSVSTKSERLVNVCGCACVVKTMKSALNVVFLELEWGNVRGGRS